MSSLTEQNKIKLFRTDINALRAWAVISVMLYHFQVPGFSGGFSGVDVFFVISGFLMTGIVVNGLEGNKFSVLDFYIARARRIVPALLVLCAFLFLLGWLILAPDDYADLARHIRDSLLFYSNSTYRKESGYFDSESHDKWLLHTWSLSVEWQFYLLLPIIIIGLWRWKKSENLILVFFIFLAILSFLMCVIRTQVSPDSAFYSLKYRCWEMLLGGIAYFLDKKIHFSNNARRMAFYVGVLLIAVPVFIFDSNSSWPGWRAAFPVVGTFLFIVAANKTVFTDRLFFLQWFGSKSYSIYLWHWPIVVLLAYFERENSYIWIVVGVITSCIAGWISYKWIEIPSGYFLKSMKKMGFVFLCVAILVFSSIGIIKFKGFPERVSSEVIKIRAEKNNINPRGAECDSYGESEPVSCIYGGKNIKAIVLGDSHANALVTAVAASLKTPEDGLAFWGRSACPFIIGAKGVMDEEGCTGFNAWAMEKLKTEPANIPVIMISRFSYYALGANEKSGNKISSKPKVYFSKEYELPDPDFLTEFKMKSLATICEVAKFRKVYMIKPIPEMRVDVPKVLTRARMAKQDRRVFITLEEYHSRNDFIINLEGEAAKNCGIEILDPLPYLCSDSKCFGDSNGMPLYSDDDHLSEYGNQSLIPMFSTVFK